MLTLNVILYVLAALTSFACTALLFRSYVRSRQRLLLWSALCFVGLTVGNVLVFFDLAVYPGPEIDLRLDRLLAALAGLGFLLYGFIMESD
ncbi:MAG TPA: DUF5985 family protein [Burkholderiales bacterium]|jgi:hypothetical protein|nr:DUF5985 family protein [Burkholderiales bacterium]